MQDITQGLDGTGLTSGSNLNLGIDSGLISTIITVGTIISIVLTLVFIVYLIFNIAHRWKSEKAMVEMGKDIREIKELLVKNVASKEVKSPVVLATTTMSEDEEPPMQV